MPSGKHTTDSMRKEVLRLRAQGLTYKVIATRTGLCINAVVAVIKRSERKP